MCMAERGGLVENLFMNHLEAGMRQQSTFIKWRFHKFQLVENFDESKWFQWSIATLCNISSSDFGVSSSSLVGRMRLKHVENFLAIR